MKNADDYVMIGLESGDQSSIEVMIGQVTIAEWK